MTIGSPGNRYERGVGGGGGLVVKQLNLLFDIQHSKRNIVSDFDLQLATAINAGGMKIKEVQRFAGFLFSFVIELR